MTLIDSNPYFKVTILFNVN